ncbi:expressed unknown protein [Seminavis robusta]|uniref:Uncharacterized protein n=1 Tax=Seminavis robusta TaxID=568900 RepID=A0A9N8HG14_9STRA|nr:expressed unknown protein [Seminavis robusta]|eukprot:Sro461_g147670.1 n/a (164) ;mRNA; r:9420-9911
MLSTTIARSFVRSAQRPCVVRALTTSWTGTFTGNSDPFHNGSVLGTQPSNFNHDRSSHQGVRVELPVILQQGHPGTPVFVGFAPMQLPKEDPTMFWGPLEDDTATGPQSTEMIVGDEIQGESLQMMNRNARSSKRHKANHGKRPCNRNARRSKKIKLGRRRRS